MIRVKFISHSTENTSSNEQVAAEALRDRFQEDLSIYPNAKGDIYILPSVRIYGQRRSDIDILVFGFVDGLTIKNVRTKNGEVNELSIKSFITNIELKSHPSDKVSREGSDYIVKYGGVSHNATEQCGQAKFAVLNYISIQLGIKPFVADILWLNGLSQDDLCSMRNGVGDDNALPCEFSFKNYIEKTLLLADPKGGALDMINADSSQSKALLELFTKKREPQGLTKKKFETISQTSLDLKSLPDDIGKKMTILTGRAGTGKTILLLQIAFKLANDYSKRCLMLTYNNALVSDIQRLIDYSRMPTKLDGRTVAIKTIDSFFLSLMKEFKLVKKELNPSMPSYTDDYKKGLEDLYSYVVDLCDENDIVSLKDLAQAPIDWDYILIDEAQDFSDDEKEILFKLYGANRLVVADGVDQFMRTAHRQQWGQGLSGDDVWKPKEMQLERRQRANLVTFVNAFAQAADLDWKVRPNSQLPGGEVKIYRQYTSDIHIELTKKCQKNKCENYDILILVPPNMVVYDNENNNHSLRMPTNTKVPVSTYSMEQVKAIRQPIPRKTNAGFTNTVLAGGLKVGALYVQTLTRLSNTNTNTSICQKKSWV